MCANSDGNTTTRQYEEQHRTGRRVEGMAKIKGATTHCARKLGTCVETQAASDGATGVAGHAQNSSEASTARRCCDGECTCTCRSHALSGWDQRRDDLKRRFRSQPYVIHKQSHYFAETLWSNDPPTTINIKYTWQQEKTKPDDGEEDICFILFCTSKRKKEAVSSFMAN